MKLPKRYVAKANSSRSGGMSSTIVCEDTNLARDVIVKSLQAGVDQRRLIDELQALQTIRSKHVVQIYDVIRDQTGGVAGIVEEYLPGDELTVATHPIEPTAFLKIAYAIAEGISDIHRHGQVHRDIKRQNMKFDAEGCLKIFDFGLARDLAINASTVGVVGTPGFMAPELFQATSSGTTRFTEAVDTFAFGATMLEVAVGRLPGPLCQMPPTLPVRRDDFRKLPFALPSEIAAYLDACLDPLPSDRPHMRDVKDRLALYLLRDRHRALIVSRGKPYNLDASNRIVELSVTGQGHVKVEYDGLRFRVSDVSGDVAINNMSVQPGHILPGSCVIVLGHPSTGIARTNITIDVSHPEVAL